LAAIVVSGWFDPSSHDNDNNDAATLSLLLVVLLSLLNISRKVLIGYKECPFWQQSFPLEQGKLENGLPTGAIIIVASSSLLS
jgi:hypothetical protein